MELDCTVSTARLILYASSTEGPWYKQR